MALPLGAQPPLPTNSVSLNGPNDLAIERYKIFELMNGFPAHRDNCEWAKMRALFADEEAYVFTTWSGGVPIDEFIKISEAGFAKGVKIAHRVNGSTIDISTSHPNRALGKLKATITQRFRMPLAGGKEGETCDVDVDADCRLCFFLEKKEDGDWKNHFFKGFYEKDRLHPVDPRFLPQIDDEELVKYPEGYRYLGYAQHKAAGYPIKMDLPQSSGPEHVHFYESFIKWLEGASIEEMKVELGV
ncbi:hypothetical protein JCM8547_000122 [Rhodosporidiobolus lusitaniae]